MYSEQYMTFHYLQRYQLHVQTHLTGTRLGKLYLYELLKLFFHSNGFFFKEPTFGYLTDFHQFYEFLDQGYLLFKHFFAYNKHLNVVCKYLKELNANTTFIVQKRKMQKRISYEKGYYCRNIQPNSLSNSTAYHRVLREVSMTI